LAAAAFSPPAVGKSRFGRTFPKKSKPAGGKKGEASPFRGKFLLTFRTTSPKCTHFHKKTPIFLGQTF
jgi:hypothetical protein